MSFFFYDRNRFRSSNYRVQYGSSDNNLLTGSNSRDFIEGNQGNDNLYGYGGNDLLVGVDPDAPFPGFNERDRLTGGSGSDTFVLGDANNIYYSNYSWETDNYATITDYDDRYDFIVVHGDSNNYRFQDFFVIGEGSLYDPPNWQTRLMYGDDIIAVFEGGRQSDLGLELGSIDFIEL